MSESTPSGKGKVQKIETSSKKKACTHSSALLNELAQDLFNGLLDNDSQHGSEQHDAAKTPRNESTNNLSKYVAFASRGKAIGVRNLNTTHRINLISQAIASGVCISGRYNRRERILQPCGIIVREPKIYLLAAEYEEDNSRSAENTQPVIKQYLCHRFEHLALTEISYVIPENFNVQDHIDSGSLEQSISSLKASLPDPFELVLKLHDAKKDSLLRDLEELPLGKRQSLIQEDDNGTYRLKVPNQRATHELLEWILGRQERVEVIQPEVLRQYVIGRIHAIAHRYIGSDQLPIGPNGFTAVSNVEPSKALKNEVPFLPCRSKYAANDNTNTAATWMVVRLLCDMRITEELMSAYELRTVRSIFPTAMRSLWDKSEPGPFTTAAHDFLSKQKEPEFDDTDPFTKNTADLAELLNLSQAELLILRISAMLSFIPNLHEAAEFYLPETTEYSTHTLLSLLTNQSAEQAEFYLRDDQTLRHSGLIMRYPVSIMSAKDVLEMSPHVVTALFQNHPKDDNILGALLKRSSPALTTEPDLQHLSAHIDHASRLIKGSTPRGVQGTNILLWGAPGTGKTQLARYLGQSLGLDTYEVPTINSKQRVMSESARFSSYKLCQSLLARSSKAILIFDEVENIIEETFHAKESLSKAYINQTLEENPTPSIWISNQIRYADPAYLRRFDYSIEIKTPDKKIKRLIANRILGSLPIDGELLDDFLERQEVGPALLTKLKRVADITGADDQAAVDALALSIVEGDLAALGAPELVRRIKQTNEMPSMKYDPAMINTDINIENFADQLQTGAGVRLCLYGPPGTGKTAWAKQLAKDLNKPAHIKQLSDIKNMYVGGSEANVASAFAKAKKENAVLIFDEVDSYLRDRQSVDRNHEADLVNQFLTSLENHNGIVVCSTNFIEAIDTAAVRRFDYKIKFDYLHEDQANSLLLQLAKLSGIDIDLEELRQSNLTLPGDFLAPGDFAAILRRSQSTTIEMTIEEIHAALMAEAEFRNPPTGNKVGFV